MGRHNSGCLSRYVCQDERKIAVFHYQLRWSHIAVRRAQVPTAVLWQEFWIRTYGSAPSRVILKNQVQSNQNQKQNMYRNISIVGVDTVDRAEGKAATVLVSRPPRAALLTGGAADSRMRSISRRLLKSFLSLGNYLSGDEPLSYLKPFRSECGETEATVRVGRSAALLGKESA